MKTLLYFTMILLVCLSCNSTKTFPKDDTARTANDTIRIANDELQYEIIIIDAGFNTWLTMNARPRGFYSQSYMETRNRVWVNEWNNRANHPQGRRNLFEMPINYDSTVDYGYEVNYLLFNYLTYFQIQNNITLGGFTPKI